MKKKISLWIFLCCFSLFYGQNLELGGTIVEDDNDVLLPQARVYLISKTKDTLFVKSNYDGKYAFKNLKKGEYNIKVYSDSGPHDIDTIINLTETKKHLELRLKSFEPHSFPKNYEFEFRFSQTPSCSFNYEYVIKKDSLYLLQTLKVRKYKRKKSRLTLEHHDYAYQFKPEEKMKVENIVNTRHLLNSRTYEKRITVWGSHWEAIFDYQSIQYHIDLPNYHNEGFEELLNYVISLVPKSKKLELTR